MAAHDDVAPLRCPRCDHTFDSHDNTRDPAVVPRAGDVSICWGCGNVAVFESPTALREATPGELVEIRQDPEVRRALAACAEAYTPTQAVDLVRGGR